MENEKFVCAECGSDRVIERRLVEFYKNDCYNHGYNINDELIDYDCGECGCMVEIMTEEEYKIAHPTRKLV